MLISHWVWGVFFVCSIKLKYSSSESSTCSKAHNMFVILIFPVFASVVNPEHRDLKQTLHSQIKNVAIVKISMKT